MCLCPTPQYGNMGAMAVTLAQTLGQNLGMMWNKHRSSAGVSPGDTPHPPRGKEGVRGQAVGLDPLSCPPGLSSGDCKCPDIWLGCIMEDTG